MEQSIKNYLSISLIVLSLVGAFGVAYYVITYGNSQTFNAPAFYVSGEGKVAAIPDVAQFTFSVTNEGGQNLADTQTRNTETTNKVIEFLKTSGVEAKDIRTIGYNVYPRYSSTYCGPIPLSPVYYNESGYGGGSTDSIMPEVCPPSTIVGYTVEQTVQVKVRALENVGSVLSGVIENGANSTSQLSFTVDDRTEYENEARALAIAEAKSKAEAVAEAGGFRIGKLLSVDEYFAGPYYDYGGYGGGGETLDTRVVPSVEPGSQEIIITVNLRYEIK